MLDRPRRYVTESREVGRYVTGSREAGRQGGREVHLDARHCAGSDTGHK